MTCLDRVIAFRKCCGVVLTIVLAVAFTIALLGSLVWFIYAACKAECKKEDALTLLTLLISQPLLGTGAVVGLAVLFKVEVANLLAKWAQPPPV